MIDTARFYITRCKVGLQCLAFSCWVRSLMLLVSIAYAPNVWALHAPPERLASLVVQGLLWEPMETMTLSGVPTYLKPFASEVAAAPVVRSLSAHTDLFQRVLTMPGTVILSGMQADWHWLAQVDTSTKGAKGYVSAMRINPFAAGASSAGKELEFAWLPAQAQRRFVYRSTTSSSTVAQHVYSITLTIQALTAYVRRQLRAEGWKEDPAIAGVSAYSAWRRQSSRLTLFTQAAPTGTDLYVHHVE